MQLKQKLAYIALGIFLVLGWQLSSRLIVPRATADQHEKEESTMSKTDKNKKLTQ